MTLMLRQIGPADTVTAHLALESLARVLPRRPSLAGVAPFLRTPENWVVPEEVFRCPVLTHPTHRSSGRRPSNSPAAVRNRSRRWRDLGDPNDALAWRTAVIAVAGYLISHNTAHFPPLVRERTIIDGQDYQVQRHLHRGIEFLTAIEFIEGVLGEDTATIYERALPVGGIVRSRRAATPM